MEEFDNTKMKSLLEAILRTTWNSLNDWMSALNTAKPAIKELVTFLIRKKDEETLSETACNNSAIIHDSLRTMNKVVDVLTGLVEQIQKLRHLEYDDRPIFIKLTLSEFEKELQFLLDSYKNETELKESASNKLPYTTSVDELNACITLWTTFVYLPQPHLFHIKALLLEAGLL